MLRSRDPNQLPAPQEGKIPALSGGGGGSSSSSLPAETKVAANTNLTGSSPSLGVTSALSPAAVSTTGHANAALASTQCGTTQQKPMMMTFKRVGISAAMHTPSSSAKNQSSPSATILPYGSSTLPQQRGRPALHVVECDPAPAWPGEGSSPAGQQPSLSLRRATRPTVDHPPYLVVERPRSPSPEPVAPSPLTVQKRVVDAAEPASRFPDDGKTAEDAAERDESVSAIVSTGRARSLERDFVPDHLLNNEDFIDRLVSEVRHSCHLPGDGDEAASAYSCDDSDGEGYVDAEVLACLRTGSGGSGGGKKAKQPNPQRPQWRSGRSRSPARSRSPSPCVEAVVLTAPATGNTWSPGHQGRQQQQRPSCLNGTTCPTHSASHATAGTAAKPSLLTRNRGPVKNECDADVIEEETLGKSMSSIAAATLSRESSPAPHEPSPLSPCMLEAAKGSPAAPQSPFASAAYQRGRREGGVARDRGTSPRARSPQLQQSQPRSQRCRSVSPTFSGNSIGRRGRVSFAPDQQVHPTWEPHPIQQHRPAWGQRVPARQAHPARTAVQAPSDRELRTTSPSLRAPSIAQQSSPAASEHRGSGGRSHTASARVSSTDSTETEPNVATTTAAAAAAAAAAVEPAAVAASASAEAASTGPRQGGRGSTCSSSPQPPFARVLFGDAGLSPLSLTESGSSAEVNPCITATAIGGLSKQEVESPLFLSGLMETVHIALTRATRAEARSAELEKELHTLKAQREQESDAFETRLAQMAGQLSFALRWIHNCDPAQAAKTSELVAHYTDIANEARPPKAMPTNTRQPTVEPVRADGVGECDLKENAAEDASAATTNRSATREGDRQGGSAVYDKNDDLFTDPRPCCPGTPGAQGATPTPSRGDGDGGGSGAVVIAGTTGTATLRMPPSPPLVLHLQS